MKRATILDTGYEMFGVEYDNTIGKTHTMRLEAATYDEALREARAYLGINENDRDEDGELWAIE
jgi:hypothetical protein